MRNRRFSSWSMSLLDLRDRAPHPAIREERLRSTAGLREPDALSSWRGRSGRRYVVGVQPLAETDVSEVTDAVVIAVQRSGDGTAAVVDVAMAGDGMPPRARLGWLSSMRARGATEVHVHRLADSEAERQAVLADLVSPAS